MKRSKKILAYILAFALVISTLYAGEIREIMADSTYLIQVTDSDTYLYANGSGVASGALIDGDARYQWILIQKDDGTYWIQNQSTGGYMCIENQTGKVELLSQIYDVWASCKWNLNPNTSTTIQSAWLGASANINISGTEAVYGNGTQTFTFVSTTGGTTDPIPTGGRADSVVIPETNDDVNTIGATMPYTRYDSQQASLGGGAVLAYSNNYDKNNIASQASNQSYVRLPGAGSYAEWTVNTTGNGVTMRFTMPDSSDGMGLTGSLDVYVNENKVTTVDLTSYYMWQYFEAPNPSVNPTGSPSDVPVTGATPAFAFDEVHFRLDTSLKQGDKIRIQSSGTNGLEYGVDFLEIEETGAAIAKPDNAYSVTDFGAVANDGNSDYTAIQNCISQAQRDGKDVYFPEGTFEIGQIWTINASNIKISGAGIWYTNIQFTNSASGSGGISGSKANNVEFCNMYLNSNLRSRYGQEAVYKCFMDVWSGGSYIHDIWEEHFECGFWLADYNFGDGTDYCDGIKITNSRIRNNLADGVNFCQGTSNATVYNCSIRNNGDDGLAMWNNNYQVKDEENNVFCYNTIEFVWRAGGIAIYGGNGHKVYNNYISDMFMASGIHISTGFDGYKFTNNNTGINLSNNILVRSGTTSDSWYSDLAAIDITEPNGTVKNITFNNTYIYEAQHDAVKITGNPSNIVFNNLKVYGTGMDGNITCEDDNGALFKFADKNTSPNVTVSGLEYANIAYSGIIYGTRNNCSISNESNLGSGYTYEIPSGTLGSAVEIPTEAPTTVNPTTAAETITPVPVTEPETTTQAETLLEVIGAVVNEVNGNTVTFAWGQTEQQITLGYQYNVYIDGQLYKTTQGAETITYTFDSWGSHVILIRSVLGDRESEGVQISVNIEEIDTIPETTPQQTTEPETTPIQTTEPETTPEQVTEPETTSAESETQSRITDKIKIEGFQISPVNLGIRAVSSVEPEINGKKVVRYGNIYGIVREGYSDEDMVIGSDSPWVKQFESTSDGIIDINFSDSSTAVNYVMTMIHNGTTDKAYSQSYKIRGYAELSDGSYVYSDIREYSIFKTASVLYDNNMMNTYEAHVLLYNNILKVVDSNYKETDYNWGNIIVKP